MSRTKLSWLIRRTLRNDPSATPKDIAAELGTTAKYVSRISRSMQKGTRPKFKTGPKPKKEKTNDDPIKRPARKKRILRANKQARNLRKL